MEKTNFKTEIIKCVICGKAKRVYKYRKQKCCSKKCATIYNRFKFKSNIIDRYLMNESISKIAKNEKCNEMTIRRYLKHNKIRLKKSLFHNTTKFKPSKLSEIEKSYIAGLFDGEGCLYRQKSKMWSLCIANTNLKVIKWIYRKIKGGAIYKKYKLYKNSKHRTLYWSLNKQQAIYWFLQQIYSYSIIKKPKIKKALAFYNYHINKWNKKL